MYSLRLKEISTPLTLLTLHLYSFVSPVTAGTCYWPDSTEVSPDYYVPCNATADVSACCASGDACTTKGLCLGSAGYVYRGGCTDKTWTSSVCLQQCITTGTSDFQNLYPCVAGESTNLFCCGNSESSSCCSSNFSSGSASGYEFTGYTFMPAAEADSGTNVSTVTATVTATAAAATATGPVSSSGVSTGGVVGAAIGSAIGGALLGLLAGFLVWKRARHPSQIPAPNAYASGLLDEIHGGKSVYHRDRQGDMAELPSAVVSELSAENRRK